MLDIELPDGAGSRIRIRRVHLEEDTGRSVHEGGYSYVDLNRAGVPLMEIVTEADIHSAEQAYAFLTELAHDAALSGRQQRRHGKGRHALRAEHQRAHAAAGRTRRIWRQSGGEEPQQLPRRAQRHRV